MFVKDLPEELTVTEAAAILGVSRKTVLQYINQRMLPVRDVAPWGSVNHSYRLPKNEVLAMRTGYDLVEPKKKSPPKPKKISGGYKPKHLS